MPCCGERLTLPSSPGMRGSCRRARILPNRMIVFGAGYGLLTFHADDASEIIRIFDITWIG